MVSKNDVLFGIAAFTPTIVLVALLVVVGLYTPLGDYGVNYWLYGGMVSLFLPLIMFGVNMAYFKTPAQRKEILDKMERA